MPVLEKRRELIGGRVVYFMDDLEDEVEEEVRALLQCYSDLLPTCRRLIVTWSPLPANGQRVFWTHTLPDGLDAVGLYLTDLWRTLSVESRRWKFAMGLQFDRWRDQGVVSADEVGVRLDLPEGLLTGQAAADHLNNVAEALMARP